MKLLTNSEKSILKETLTNIFLNPEKNDSICEYAFGGECPIAKQGSSNCKGCPLHKANSLHQNYLDELWRLREELKQEDK